MITKTSFDLKTYKETLNDNLALLRQRKIGLLDGPLSDEDFLYNQTARPSDLELPAITSSFDRLGLSYSVIDPTKDGWLQKLVECDPIYINVHGEYGEDGRLQGLMDAMKKHYIGSGVATSAIGINKPYLKNLVAGLGYETPKFYWSAWHGTKAVCNVEDLTFPVMAKPVYGGCSMGIVKLDAYSQYKEFSSDPSIKKDSYFYEEFVSGRFLTVGIMEVGDDYLVLPPLEVVTRNGFYDEVAKKDPNEEMLAEYTFPKDAPNKEGGCVQKRTYDVFKGIGGKGYARVDLMLDANNNIWILEVNTVPGMSAAGNFPAAAQQVGLSYDDLTIALLATCMGDDLHQAHRPLVQSPRNRLANNPLALDCK